MVNFFLRLKHWQLFTLLFALPFIFYIYFTIKMFSAFSSFDGSDMGEIQYAMSSAFKWIPYLIVPVMFFFYGWFWSVGVGLQEVIRPDLRLATGFFKLVILLIVICTIVLCFFVFRNLTEIFTRLDEIESGNSLFLFNPSLLIFFIPLQLLLITGSIYCMHFVARTFKTAELQREVRFGDFVVEFVLFWFYFIGIWILQPKINKLNDPVLPPPIPDLRA